MGCPASSDLVRTDWIRTHHTSTESSSMKSFLIWVPIGMLIYMGGHALAAPVPRGAFFVGVMTGLVMVLVNRLVSVAVEGR